MKHGYKYSSPLGTITIESSEHALTGLWFESQRRESSSSEELSEANTAHIREAVSWLDIYFSGKDPGKTPPLEPSGTDFQRSVWRLLLEIPYGETRSYGELARAIARERGIEKMSAQAVGGAVGRNPISIMIPCHRVIGSDGSLTGYAGGIDLKGKLLQLESRRQPFL